MSAYTFYYFSNHLLRPLILIAGLLLAFAHCNAAAAKQTLTIRYPLVMTNTIYQESAKYFLHTFKLAMDKSDADYEIEFVEIQTMPLSRSMQLIKQGLYDVHWLSTTRDREQQLKPIRIPLLKGLLGLRIALVNKGSLDLLEKADSLEKIKHLVAGQGHDWPDTQLMRHSGFRVVTASATNSLIEMLKGQRIDYFPRSIIEVWSEQAFINDPSIVVDPNFALYYPQAFYFFVRNDNKVLHQHIQTGLNRAIADGSFNENLYAYFGEYIQKAKLQQRRLFKIENPFIPAQTPLDDDSLWFRIPN